MSYWLNLSTKKNTPVVEMLRSKFPVQGERGLEWEVPPRDGWRAIAWVDTETGNLVLVEPEGKFMELGIVSARLWLAALDLIVPLDLETKNRYANDFDRDNMPSPPMVEQVTRTVSEAAAKKLGISNDLIAD